MRARFPPWGWAGLSVLIVAHAAALLQSGVAAKIFQPLLWTGAILLVDAVNSRCGRRSLISSELAALSWSAVLSVALCLLLELLNGALPVWSWLGWPTSEFVLYATLGWHFATYAPWLLVCAEAGGGESLAGQPPLRPFLEAALGAIIFLLAWQIAGGGSSVAFLAALIGLILIGDAYNRSSGAHSLWRRPRLLAILAAASMARYFVEREWRPGAAGGRFFVAPEGPDIYAWAVGLLLGPAVFVFYLGVASLAGTPLWSGARPEIPDKEKLNFRIHL